MVWPKNVTGLVGWSVQYADIVADRRLVGTGQLWHQQEIERSLPRPELDRVVVSRLVCLLEQISRNVVG